MFSDTDCLERLNAMDQSQQDELDFGVVRMDHNGIVDLYNTYEMELAGLDREQALGKNFFIEVAPCTNNFMVHNRFVEEDTIDDEIDYMFTYKLKPTPIKMRLLKGKSNQYLLVKLK